MREAVVVSTFLSQDRFEYLRSRVLQVSGSERVHLPVHKKGATIAYKTLQLVAPEIVDFYQSSELMSTISFLTGDAVQPTPERDQSSCSILIYERPGDHIGWHYDWNFYDGKHFTALLAVVNEDASGLRTSSADLIVRASEREWTIPTPPNTLVVFEGRFVRHCVRPLGAREKRVVLSMTFCTNPNASLTKSIARRFKDIAYSALARFGPDAVRP